MLAATSLTAQTRENSNDVGLVKEIKVQAYAGKKYRIKADIKGAATDSSSQWGLFILQVGKNDYDFIKGSAQSNLSTTPNEEWRTFSIEKTILPGSRKIWIYLRAIGNGDFYFDNLVFEIATDSNTWQPIYIDNADFEATSSIKKVLKGFKNTEAATHNPNIKTSVAVLGNNKVLCIASRNNTVSYRTVYGHNPAAGNYITVKDGKKIYYETYGTGEPLLLLHGNGGSIYAFRNSIPELAKHYQVIAVDTRGQGNSVDEETAAFNYELFAGDLEMLVEKLGFKKVTIVGWSDGAIIGLLLSIRHPDLVDKLVLMGANLNPSEEAVSRKILHQTRKDIARLRQQNDPGNRTTIRLLEMLLAHPHIPPADLHQIKARTLVMAGEKDLVLEQHTRLIAEHIAQATVRIVKGATHFLPEENAALFNKIVLAFLQGN